MSALIEAIEIIAKQTHRQDRPASPTDTTAATPATAPPLNRAVPAAALPAPVSTASSDQSPPAPKPKSATPPHPQTPVQPQPTLGSVDLSRLELLMQQVLVELRKSNEAQHDDFSISKLVAGITQVLALAAILLSYFLYRTDVTSLHSWLLVSVFLQTFTIALLIMSRQK